MKSITEVRGVPFSQINQTGAVISHHHTYLFNRLSQVKNTGKHIPSLVWSGYRTSKSRHRTATVVLHKLKQKLVGTKGKSSSTLKLVLLRLLVTPTDHPLIAKVTPVGSPFQVLVLTRRKTCASYIIKGQWVCHVTYLGLNSYPFGWLHQVAPTGKKKKSTSDGYCTHAEKQC